jgi:hypothetical protein
MTLFLRISIKKKNEKKASSKIKLIGSKHFLKQASLYSTQLKWIFKF